MVDCRCVRYPRLAQPKCYLERNEHLFVDLWLRFHPKGEHHCAPKLHARSDGSVSVVLYQLPDLPLPSWSDQVHRHRLGSPRLLHHFDFTHGLGRCHRPDGDSYPLQSLAQRLSPPPSHRPLDASNLALCFRDGRPDLPDALSLVSAPLKFIWLEPFEVCLLTVVNRFSLGLTAENFPLVHGINLATDQDTLGTNLMGIKNLFTYCLRLL